MDYKKELLLSSTEDLYRAGLDCKAARARLAQLTAQGFPDNSDEMQQAMQDFKALHELWDILEGQYRELWNKLLQA